MSLDFSTFETVRTPMTNVERKIIDAHIAANGVTKLGPEATSIDPLENRHWRNGKNDYHAIARKKVSLESRRKKGIRRLREQGHSATEIAEALGWSVDLVFRDLKHLGML